MKITCKNCNKTFYINDNDIKNYDLEKLRENDFLLQSSKSMINAKKYDIDSETFDLEIGKSTKYRCVADYIRSEAKDPYICPYCGEDCKENTNNFISYGKDNLSTNVLRIGILIAAIIMLILAILDGKLDYSVIILIPVFIIIIKGFYDDYKNN